MSEPIKFKVSGTDKSIGCSPQLELDTLHTTHKSGTDTLPTEPRAC